VSASDSRYQKVVDFIRETFKAPEDPVPLHEPRFLGKEREYLLETIESSVVSTVGPFVVRFEEMMARTTGAAFAVATDTGTSALHMALLVSGVRPGDEVITQPLTFVGTVNAVAHAGASPVFIDVDRITLGLSAEKLADFLREHAHLNSGVCLNRRTGKRIAACVPMHTFGFPCRIDDVLSVCREHRIPVVEDAAESIGSRFQDRHLGTFGLCGIFSFNGNKTVTAGGGGAIVTDDPALAKKAKHLTTTAKVPHAWRSVHDHVAYNYRMPNLNAALACAQLEQLERFVEEKRSLASAYRKFFEAAGMEFLLEPPGARSNYWLMTLQMKDSRERDELLEYTNSRGVMTRPAWELMHRLPMFSDSQTGDLENAEWLAERLVNLPSSVRP